MLQMHSRLTHHVSEQEDPDVHVSSLEQLFQEDSGLSIRPCYLRQSSSVGIFKDNSLHQEETIRVIIYVCF